MLSLLSTLYVPTTHTVLSGGIARLVPQRLNGSRLAFRTKMTAGTAFRNPHNLPVKDCVVCGRPFTWRKKWERCWDEVTTCSNRCRTERRQGKKSKDGATLAGVSAAVAASVGKKVSRSEETDEDANDHEATDREATPEGGREGGNDSDVPEVAPASDMEEMEAIPDARSARKERKAALKAAKRERRAQSPQDKADAKRKPCDKCSRRVDLLIRCRIDISQKWFMLCGRCWKDASGGVPDGDAEHPHYKYGGLWKNRAAKVTTPSFGGAKVAKEEDAQESLQGA